MDYIAVNNTPRHTFSPPRPPHTQHQRHRTLSTFFIDLNIRPACIHDTQITPGDFKSNRGAGELGRSTERNWVIEWIVYEGEVHRTKRNINIYSAFPFHSIRMLINVVSLSRYLRSVFASLLPSAVRMQCRVSRSVRLGMLIENG